MLTYDVDDSNCSYVQQWQPEYNDWTEIQLLFAILYLSVWITAVVGNVLVLYILTRSQVTFPVRTVFVRCLAISDLLMCLFSLPITAVSIFSRVWIFPAFFCKLIGVFQGGSIFVSSFTLTIIAIDRCLLILRPNDDFVNYNRAAFVVFTIWLLGYSLAFPVGFYSSVTKYEGICGSFCEENWPDINQEGKSNTRRAYGTSVLILQFGIPAMISTICYWMISRVMANQLERRRGQKLRPENEEKLIQRKTRANRMMIVMVVGFVIAWMPFNVINLYRDLSGGVVTPWYSSVFALCHVFAMCSAVLNPIIYSWFNPKFRNSVTALFRRPQSTAYKSSVTTKQTKTKFADTRQHLLPQHQNNVESNAEDDQLL